MALLAMQPALMRNRPAEQASTPETVTAVNVTSDDARRMTSYTAASSVCRVRWEVFPEEPSGGVIRRYSDCNRSWSDEIPLLSAVAVEAFKEPRLRHAIRTLTWGRLAPDGAKDTPMAMRLAAAAAASPRWSRALGRPKTGDLNGFIRDLANEAHIYAELEGILVKAGMNVTVSTVEKVLVGRAGGLAGFEVLRRQGLRAGDKVPFDCQIWFRLTPE